MKVLITGASGFIGQKLCSQLRGKATVPNVEVIGLSRNATSFTGTLDGFVEADLSQDIDLAPHLEHVDVVIHLASRVHIMHDTSKNPLESYRTMNRDASKRLAEAAVRAGVKRFIFLSSIKVNGEETIDSAFSVLDQPKPIDPYGISKLEAEQAILAAAEGSQMKVIILRPPLVYGPGVRANFLSLLKAVQRGIPLPLGKVSNRRHLIFVENLCDAILHSATSPKAKSGVYLIADDESISTPDLLRETARFLNRPSRLVPVPAGLLRFFGRLIGRSSQISRLTGNLEVDNSCFKRETDWRPPYSVHEGLRETCKWFSRRSQQSESHS